MTRMRPQTRRPSSRRHHARGLSLVEILVCLGISAMLLTAMGTAFYGGFNNYRDGAERGQLLQGGRTLLWTITRDIRMADVHNAYDADGTRRTLVQNQFISGLMPGYPTSGLSGNGGSGAAGIQMIKTHADSQRPLGQPQHSRHHHLLV